jgi:hypothetical protein
MPYGAALIIAISVGTPIAIAVRNGRIRLCIRQLGKNKLDYETKSQKAYELMGDEQSKLWAKTLLIARKFYTRVGWIEGELSYAPAPN